MSVVWAAASPGSGRFSTVEKRSEVRDLPDRLDDPCSRGQEYIEVRLPNRELPVLMPASRDDQAVVHLMRNAERMSLLAGDGTLSSDTEAAVPNMDELVAFTGDFAFGIVPRC